VIDDCQQLWKFCLDYLDGALPEDEQVGFRRHLSQCPDCVTFFETYRKTPELSREALPARIPSSVREAVRTFLVSRRSE
jgi:anti-sigma factor RsiW